MGSDDASKGIFGLRIISIAVVIALIVGAGTGYMVGNSPLTSLMEERDSLEAEYDSLDLAFQSLEVELASTQESLVEEQGVNALLQEGVIELENQIEIQLVELASTQESLVEEQRVNALLQDRVIELENQIEALEDEIYELNIKLDSSQTTIETLEDVIDELSSQLDSSQTRTIIIDLIGTCIRVIDGDTFELSSGKRVRLADIDAPESYEPGYDISTIALSSWIQGETVYLDIDDISGTDIYGRYVCVVYVEYVAGYANINLALLVGGYAVQDDYPNEFDPDDWGTPGNLDMSEASQDTPPSPPPPPPPPPEPDPPEPEPEGIYVGSINSNKYHYPWCYWAGQINPENEIWFTSKADAESHGYVPCKVCKP